MSIITVFLTIAIGVFLMHANRVRRQMIFLPRITGVVVEEFPVIDPAAKAPPTLLATNRSEGDEASSVICLLSKRVPIISVLSLSPEYCCAAFQEFLEDLGSGNISFSKIYQGYVLFVNKSSPVAPSTGWNLLILDDALFGVLIQPILV